MLRALDGARDDQTVGKVVVAVGADAVGGVQTVLFVADQGEGFFAVVEAQYILAGKIGGGADFDPAVGIGLCFDAFDHLGTEFLRLGQFAFHMIPRIIQLPDERRQDLPPG